MANVRFYSGTRAQYDSLVSHNPLALYFCDDTGELFKGDICLSDGIRIVPTRADLPECSCAADGIVYFIAETKSGFMVSPDRTEWLQTIYAPVTDAYTIPEEEMYTTVTTVGAVRDIEAKIYKKIEEVVSGGTLSDLTPVDGTISIVDNKIGVQVSKAEGNLVAVKDDGLFMAVDLEPLNERLQAVENAIIGGIHYKGSVPTVDDLPTNPVQGDLYEIEADGSEYCWNGEKWFAYGTSHFAPVAKDGIVISNGNEISVKLSPVDDNALRFVDGALYVAPGMSNEEKEIFDSIPETYASKIEMDAAIAKAIEEAQPTWEDLTVNLVEFDGSVVDYTQNTAFQRAIKDLAEGSTVVLKNGNFRVAFLDEYSVPKNLTVLGGKGAIVTNFSLETNIDGLTLRNLNFAENAYIYGIANKAYTIKNLTIDNCAFEKGFIYIGLAEGSSLENIVITNCKVNGAIEGLNGITLYNVNNATIKGNTINNSDDIGIALLGTISGTVDVENNVVAGTGDRAFRVNKVQDNAVITYKNNIISNCEVAFIEGEGLFKVTSTGVGAFIIFNGNTYNGTAWMPNNIGENASSVIYTIV